ncbi:hypothetical protein DESC_800009 [Desulfosarcina cetonica]|nr:hypothetical protein DESC_800009 [Desulfosarcina cetonica]
MNGYRLQGNVFGLRYRLSRYYYTASSLWPCHKHFLKPYISECSTVVIADPASIQTLDENHRPNFFGMDKFFY